MAGRSHVPQRGVPAPFPPLPSLDAGESLTGLPLRPPLPCEIDGVCLAHRQKLQIYVFNVLATGGVGTSPSTPTTMLSKAPPARAWAGRELERVVDHPQQCRCRMRERTQFHPFNQRKHCATTAGFPPIRRRIRVQHKSGHRQALEGHPAFGFRRGPKDNSCAPQTYSVPLDGKNRNLPTGGGRTHFRIWNINHDHLWTCIKLNEAYTPAIEKSFCCSRKWSRLMVTANPIALITACQYLFGVRVSARTATTGCRGESSIGPRHATRLGKQGRGSVPLCASCSAR